MQQWEPKAHGTLIAPQVEEHLRAISDHLAAVLWEHALTIVRAAETGDRESAAEARANARRSMAELGERFADETDRVVTGLAGLRRRTDGVPEPAPEQSSGPSKRASLHDSPLTDLFQRTD
jgi:hypothetical protein